MTDTKKLRILVVSGARALDDYRASREWALRELASRIFRGDVDVVAHGACRDSPDAWADSLAETALLNRARFALGDPPRLFFQRRLGWYYREIERAADYAYGSDPHARNRALARWASDRLSEGHDVRAVTLRCAWSKTNGTGYTLAELVKLLGAMRVTDLVCPAEHGPFVQPAVTSATKVDPMAKPPPIELAPGSDAWEKGDYVQLKSSGILGWLEGRWEPGRWVIDMDTPGSETETHPESDIRMVKPARGAPP